LLPIVTSQQIIWIGNEFNFNNGFRLSVKLSCYLLGGRFLSGRFLGGRFLGERLLGRRFLEKPTRICCASGGILGRGSLGRRELCRDGGAFFVSRFRFGNGFRKWRARITKDDNEVSAGIYIMYSFHADGW
jgi:hypothetical protein